MERDVLVVDGNRVDRLLSVKEVSTWLGVSVASVYAWAKDGRMPKQIKLGRASRWRQAELDEWILERPLGAYGSKKRHEAERSRNTEPEAVVANNLRVESNSAPRVSELNGYSEPFSPVLQAEGQGHE